MLYRPATLQWRFDRVPAGLGIRRRPRAATIATALFAEFRSGYAIALYILVCAVISFAAALLLPDYTNRDISQEYDKPEGLTARL